PRPARGFPRALRRRRAHAGHDGAGGRRRHLGRGQPGAARDARPRGRGRARRPRGGAPPPLSASPAHEPQLRGVEPDPGEGFAGASRALPGELSPSPLSSARLHARRPSRRAPGAGAPVLISPGDVRDLVEAYAALPVEALGDEARAVFEGFRAGLEAGTIRAAEPGPDGWAVNGWVKQGILLGFRLGRLVEMTPAGPLRLFDHDTV